VLPPFCLGEQVDLHTARELEHLILRWQKVRDQVDVSSRASPLLKRHFSVRIVEGGCWPLVTLVPTPFDNDEESGVLCRYGSRCWLYEI